jgi:hypothetical protein
MAIRLARLLPTPFNPYNTMRVFSELGAISLIQEQEEFPVC